MLTICLHCKLFRLPVKEKLAAAPPGPQERPIPGSPFVTTVSLTYSFGKVVPWTKAFALALLRSAIARRGAGE